MDKCTSCILYKEQNPTTYKETTTKEQHINCCFSSRIFNNKPIYTLTTWSTLPPPPFPKKRRKKMVINRVLDLICRVLLVLVL